MEDIKKQSQPQQSSTAPVMDIQSGRSIQIEQPDIAPAPVGPPVSEQTAPSENNPQAAPILAAIAPGRKSNRAPILAVITAIIISGIFAAVAVTMYLSNSDTKQSTDSSQQANSSTGQENTATTEDVTATEKAIDDGLGGVNDATDYNEAGMSDASLGL
jgi:hypothetical protein